MPTDVPVPAPVPAPNAEGRVKCSNPDCGRKSHAKGLCNRCYEQRRRRDVQAEKQREAAKGQATKLPGPGMVVVEEATVLALTRTMTAVSESSSPASILEAAARALEHRAEVGNAGHRLRLGVKSALGRGLVADYVSDEDLVGEVALQRKQRALSEEDRKSMEAGHDEVLANCKTMKERLALVEERADRTECTAARDPDVLVAKVEHLVNRSVELRTIVERLNKSMLKGVLVTADFAAAINADGLTRVEDRLILLETIIDNVMPKDWQGDIDEVAARVGELVRSKPGAGMVVVREAHLQLLAETLALPNNPTPTELLAAAASALEQRASDLVQAQVSDNQRQDWVNRIYDRFRQVQYLLEVDVSLHGASLLSVLELERLKMAEAIRRLDVILGELQ